MHFVPGWMWFAAIALVFWGITGVTQKLATNKISSELSFTWFAYAMIDISGTLALFVPIQWHTPREFATQPHRWEPIASSSLWSGANISPIASI